MALTPATRLGPYEIVALLGAGGMGEVYRARDTRLRREVAVKVLPDSFSSDSERLRRFEHEARAAGALNHPNILASYDVGAQNGCPYLVSELLEGETLREPLRSGPLSVKKSIEIAVQIAQGIAGAHEKGIVHRDLKPANIFLTTEGRVKILDFGLAKLSQQLTIDGAETDTLSAESDPGVMLGTMGYMSPEQVRGKPADARSDIFALGTIIYEMVSGHSAFQKDSAADTIAAILRQDPPELSAQGGKIPPPIERLIRHCLEKNPAERFQSARDLAFALDALSGLPTTKSSPVVPEGSQSRKWPWLLAAAGLALVALGVIGSRLLSLRVGPVALPTFQQLTFKRGILYSARFAPDGKTVIYSARWDSITPGRCRRVRGAPCGW
jgi:eukaryotic-like serine/threonine-protein kinase